MRFISSLQVNLTTFLKSDPEVVDTDIKTACKSSQLRRMRECTHCAVAQFVRYVVLFDTESKMDTLKIILRFILSEYF